MFLGTHKWGFVASVGGGLQSVQISTECKIEDIDGIHFSAYAPRLRMNNTRVAMQ